MIQFSLPCSLCALVLVFAGCSSDPTPNSSGQPPQGTNANSSSSASSNNPKSGSLKLTVHSNLDDSEMQTFPEPDSALIEKQVRALNWTDPKQRPIVHLTRMDPAGETTFVKLQGTMKTPNTDGIFRVIGYQLHGKNWTAETPLESVDAAVEILLAFRNDPEKVKTISREWKTE